MRESQSRLLALEDHSLPLLPAMLGDDASSMVDAAAGLAGGRVTAARPAQVSWRPGKSLSVRYEAKVNWDDHRKATSEHFVAVTGDEPPDGLAVVLEHEGARAAIWRFPNDPWLPGLRRAMNITEARALLDTLDVPAGPVHARLRAYRPGRRAVVEMDVRGIRLFIKIVPPREVSRLQRRHALLSSALPVPSSHGWSAEHGILVMEALPGVTLRACLEDQKRQLPSPESISELLDAIPTTGDGRQASSPLQQARTHADLLRRLLPDQETRLYALADSIEEADEMDPLVPVHGDLYEAQLLVEGGEISGLLDIDTVAAGRRSDDWATLIAHLTTLQESSHQVMRSRAQSYSTRVFHLATSQTNSLRTLRLKVASVVLGLATGPFRVQSPQWPAETRRRIALAERWVQDSHE